MLSIDRLNYSRLLYKVSFCNVFQGELKKLEDKAVDVFHLAIFHSICTSRFIASVKYFYLMCGFDLSGLTPP